MDRMRELAERLSDEIAETLSTEYGQLVRQDIPYVTAKIREAMEAQALECENEHTVLEEQSIERYMKAERQLEEALTAKKKAEGAWTARAWADLTERAHKAERQREEALALLQEVHTILAREWAESSLAGRVDRLLAAAGRRRR